MERGAVGNGTSTWPHGHGHRSTGAPARRAPRPGPAGRHAFVLAADPVDGARLARDVAACGLVATAAFQPAHARAWLPFLDVDLVVVDHPELAAASDLDTLRTLSGAPVVALSPVPCGTRGEAIVVLARDTASVVIRSELRRMLALPPGGEAPAGEDAEVTAGGVTLPADRTEVLLDGQPLAVTPRQWRLLHALLLASGAVVPTARLAAALGHDHYPVTAVEAALVRLAGRFRTLQQTAVAPAIERVAGGYRLVGAAAARGGGDELVVLSPAPTG